jgi:uncharacterized membrane protein
LIAHQAKDSGSFLRFCAEKEGEETFVEQFAFIFRDIIANFSHIEFVDVARPGFFALWLICLFTPLKGVDRRDRMCGGVYALFMASAGVALLIALPQRWVGQSMTLVSQMVMVIFMASGSFMRWEIGKDKFKAVEVLKESKVKEGEIVHGKELKKERKKRE